MTTNNYLKHTFTLSAVLAVGLLQASAAECPPAYKNPAMPIEQRVNDLLGRMTREEKILQINQYTLGLNDNENNRGEVENIPAEIGSVIYFDQDPQLRNLIQHQAMEQTRLGIPILFGYDVIHGFRTIGPIPLAQSCSWNPRLVHDFSRDVAIESRAAGVDWTFSPMLDVTHDPRWGRVSEGYGEDPYTTGVYARAVVTGYQGNGDLTDHSNIASCLKHYVGYGASEAGLDYVYSEISRPTLWNTYLLPFEEGIAAGAATVMSGFNDISGIPATCNSYLLTDVLRDKWQHTGFVVSDWTAIEQLINQGVAADRKEAAMKAFNAGVDMDIIDNCYHDHISGLIDEGKVEESRLDDAVSRILRLKFRLGLFDNPYVEETPREGRILRPEHCRTAERLAEESMVLLKNDNSLLPLTRRKRIALIGPMINNREDLLGWWWGHGDANDVCTLTDAVRKEFGENALTMAAEGCDIEGTPAEDYAKIISLAEKADVIVACLGEKRGWSGENNPMATISLPEGQEWLLADLKKTGKPIVLVLSAGRPLDLSRIEALADAIVMMWQPGIAGGRPLAGILSGRVNPSGKLSITFPRSAAQIPIYYNRRRSSRPAPLGFYRDIPSSPMYEFGHGLSYTTFEYGEPRFSGTEETVPTISATDSITVEIPVTNTGQRDGRETIMWFICDPAASTSRPAKELRYFEKQEFAPGQTKICRFNIKPLRDLSFRDAEGNHIVEPGAFHIMAGGHQLTLNIK